MNSFILSLNDTDYPMHNKGKFWICPDFDDAFKLQTGRDADFHDQMNCLKENKQQLFRDWYYDLTPHERNRLSTIQSGLTLSFRNIDYKMTWNGDYYKPTHEFDAKFFEFTNRAPTNLDRIFHMKTIDDANDYLAHIKGLSKGKHTKGDDYAIIKGLGAVSYTHLTLPTILLV